MSHSLNSFKGVIQVIIQGILQGTTVGAIKGDIRSLDPKPQTLNPRSHSGGY